MSPSKLTNWFMAAFLLGIGYGTPLLNFPTTKQKVLLILLFISIFLFRKKRLLLFLLVISSGAVSGLTFIQQSRTSRFTTYPTQVLEFTARVSNAPDIRQNKTFLTVTPESPIGKSPNEQPLPGMLLLHANRYPQFNYGDRIKVKGVIETPEPFNGFNYPLFLERSGIYGVIYRPLIQPLKKANSFSLHGSLFSLRNNVEQLIQKTIPEPESSFLGGVLLGSKRAIPEDIQEALRTTGTSHIIAISGANITILLGMLLHVLPIYKRRSQFLATLSMATFVTMMTGASASVLRGAYVASLSAYIKSKGRRVWATPLILFSVSLLLLNNPLLLVADPGFQLSFAAYTGLMYLGTPISHFVEHWILTRHLPPLVQSAFSETLAATLGTAPLSFFLFGQLSLLGLIVNPLILWLLPAITALGLVLIFAGWLPFIAQTVLIPLWLLLHAVLSAVRWFGQFHFATLTWSI